MKTYLTILLSLLLIPFIGFAATTDFTADGNITVSAVTFGGSTADMIIFSGSTAESWTFNSGAFTVTNPGSAFQIGSSDSNVKSMKISSAGSVLVCAENITPGTSYATLPTSSATYTIEPSSTTDCTTLCATLANTATYNSYPGCGAASCNAGYRISGSGSSATCVLIGGGGIFVPTPPTPTPTPKAPEVAKPSPVAQIVSSVFNKTLKYGMTSDDVKRLQELLASNPEIYPEGIISGWFGQLTKKAVMAFQKKYGIEQVGIVGPQTRAKLQEVFSGEISKSQIPISKQIPSTESQIQNEELVNQIKEQIKQLQAQLTQLLQELTKMLQEKIKGLSR